MGRFKLTIESLVRQRKQRLIKAGREALILDEVIRLQEQNDLLIDELAKAQAKAKRTTKAKKTEAAHDDGNSAPD